MNKAIGHTTFTLAKDTAAIIAGIGIVTNLRMTDIQTVAIDSCTITVQIAAVLEAVVTNRAMADLGRPSSGVVSTT